MALFFEIWTDDAVIYIYIYIVEVGFLVYWVLLAF